MRPWERSPEGGRGQQGQRSAGQVRTCSPELVAHGQVDHSPPHRTWHGSSSHCTTPAPKQPMPHAAAHSPPDSKRTWHACCGPGPKHLACCSPPAAPPKHTQHACCGPPTACPACLLRPHHSPITWHAALHGQPDVQGPLLGQALQRERGVANLPAPGDWGVPHPDLQRLRRTKSLLLCD